MRLSGRAVNKLEVVRHSAPLNFGVRSQLVEMAMVNESRRTVQALRRRRGVWGAIVVGCAGILGAIAARPLVGAFRGSSPWLLPVMAAGTLVVLLLIALLVLPRITRRA
jgi:zinc transporter ZupT